MDPRTEESFTDCTIGAGAGHSIAIAPRLGPKGFLVGIDLDPAAVKSAQETLKALDTPHQVIHANFADIQDILISVGTLKVDGIIADLGFSTQQMSDEGRGFSFHSTTRPSMLLNTQSDQQDALDLLKTSDATKIADVLWRYGEERLSRKIARAIVRALEKDELETCEDLAKLVERIYPRGPHRIHPATRSFMALRIAVNRELESLERFLPAAFNCLKVGGRLGIISYHSKETSLVKYYFRRFAGACDCPPNMPVCACGAREEGEMVTGGKGVEPQESEVEANPKSRSARLRVIKRIKESLPGGTQW